MLHLLNTGEVADLLDVSRPRVSRIVQMHADFPAPYAYTQLGERTIKLWRQQDIEHWQSTWHRKPGVRIGA
jgi:hypothetical protein